MRQRDLIEYKYLFDGEDVSLSLYNSPRFKKEEGFGICWVEAGTAGHV